MFISESSRPSMNHCCRAVVYKYEEPGALCFMWILGQCIRHPVFSDKTENKMTCVIVVLVKNLLAVEN